MGFLYEYAPPCDVPGSVCLTSVRWIRKGYYNLPEHSYTTDWTGQVSLLAGGSEEIV